MTVATAEDAGTKRAPFRLEGPMRVALVGCGAVARANLLPVLAGHDRINLAALVDRDRQRAQDLADAYQVSRVLTDLDAVTRDDVDAVILATPPAHHAPATIALAGRGLHVFVEKPIATTGADARAMVDAADRAGVTLGVGLYRRFLPSVQLLKQLVESAELGAPLAIDIEEGGPYGWQLTTLAVLTRSGGGGGVLIDIGSHLIDELLHVVPGRPTLTRAEDNARGGIETDALVHFDLETAFGTVPVRLELSRTRDLRNSIRIECEDATLELRRPDFTQVLVHRRSAAGSGRSGGRPVQLTATWAGAGPYVGYQAFRDQLDDFLRGVESGNDPVLSGRSVLPVVELIDECYEARTDIPEPWTDEGLKPIAGTPPKRVLVTGAGGFLGCRTVEILRERLGWDVVALVHRPGSAARLARWPMEDAIVTGDVCSADDMARAVAGCDAVVHCAVGTTWPPEAAQRVTIEGTRIAAEAALSAGVKRFVHISTLFVHRRDGEGQLDESAPLEPNDGYGRAKLAAERALDEVTRRGLSTIVLRPVRIYGPFSRTFTIAPLRAIADGTFAISGDPDVPANMVYVDNVVEAIVKAIEAPAERSGSAYLIADAEQVSLREFYEQFARPAGLPIRLLPHARAGVRGPAVKPGLVRRWIDGTRTIATSPQFRAFVRRVINTDPIGTLPRKIWDRSPAMQQKLLRRFGSDAAVIYRPAAGNSAADLLYYGEAGRVIPRKAQEELGYVSEVERDRAIALTASWSGHARLLQRR